MSPKGCDFELNYEDKVCRYWSIRFTELQKILEALGFKCRSKGDHFIYYREGVDEIINLQPEGNKAKAYQVKQVRNLILKYKLKLEV